MVTTGIINFTTSKLKKLTIILFAFTVLATVARGQGKEKYGILHGSTTKPLKKSYLLNIDTNHSEFKLPYNLEVYTGQYPIPNTSSLVETYTLANERQYQDTLDCYYNDINMQTGETRWQKGNVVLIKGYLRAPGFACTPDYLPMVTTLFENKFIRYDGIEATSQVIQVVIREKNIYKEQK